MAAWRSRRWRTCRCTSAAASSSASPGRRVRASPRCSPQSARWTGRRAAATGSPAGASPILTRKAWRICAWPRSGSCSSTSICWRRSRRRATWSCPRRIWAWEAANAPGRRGRCWSAWALRIAPATGRASCPAASGSAFAWRGRWPAGRGFWWRTNRRARSIRRPARTCWRCSKPKPSTAARWWLLRTTPAWPNAPIGSSTTKRIRWGRSCSSTGGRSLSRACSGPYRTFWSLGFVAWERASTLRTRRGKASASKPMCRSKPARRCSSPTGSQR